MSLIPGLLPWFYRTAHAARIEPLGPEHAAALAGLHATGFAHPWSAPDFEALLADRAVNGDGLFLRPAGDPSGFALSRRVLDEAEVLTIAITPEARGRGHARPLLARHLEGLVLKGARRVHLEVEEGNGPALALYRRFGFRETGRRAAYYAKADGTRAAALTMTAVL
jgi:ribosomal-protein-alanine N-acetyltransferase